MDNKTEKLLDHILDWLNVRISSPKLKRILLKVLEKSFPDWPEIVRGTSEKGVKWGLQKLDSVKDSILAVCKKNKELSAALAKFGGKTFAIATAEFGAKECLKIGSGAAATTMSSIAVQSGSFIALKSIQKVVWNPYAIASDIAQVSLEYFGYENFGKQVGKVGNIASSAVLGGLAGGPPGVAAGLLYGAFVWYTGEVAGECVEKWMRR